MEEIDDSGSEGNRGREIRYLTSSHVRKDDSGLEDELEYFWEAPSPSDPYEREEDRWWSPGPPESSAEEDEEEVQYLTKVLGLEPKGNGVKEKEPSPPTRTMSGTKENRQAPSPRRHAEQSGGPPATLRGAEPQGWRTSWRISGTPLAHRTLRAGGGQVVEPRASGVER
jgi:hypothetical protein